MVKRHLSTVPKDQGAGRFRDSEVAKIGSRTHSLSHPSEGRSSIAASRTSFSDCLVAADGEKAAQSCFSSAPISCPSESPHQPLPATLCMGSEFDQQHSKSCKAFQSAGRKRSGVSLVLPHPSPTSTRAKCRSVRSTT